MAAKQLNPQVLAFVGDAVHSLYVRTELVLSSDAKAGVLHKRAAAAVRAEAQSEKIGRLESLLTEEEAEIYRRGRNAKTVNTAKNASVTEYHRATGFEALIGYLYLTGQRERMELFLSEDKGE